MTSLPVSQRKIHRQILTGLLVTFAVSCRIIPPAPQATAINPRFATSTPVAVGRSDMDAPIASTEPLKIPDSDPVYWGLTYHRLDGNRTVTGRTNLAEAHSVDILLAGIPEWLVAAPWGGGSLWVVMLADGTVQAFSVIQDAIKTEVIEPVQIFPGIPPLLMTSGKEVALVGKPAWEPSIGSSPVPLTSSGSKMAYISTDGRLVVEADLDIDHVQIEALPDARILVDDSRRILFLTDPTTRYGHGVLGDSIEAGGWALLNTDDGLRLITHTRLEEPAVIEGITPIWADLNGDGEREVIVTQSDDQQGARIVAYGEDGSILAAGPPIGQGYRWRHQLVVAPFGVDGELELAVVRTPHIGGVIEFYRMLTDRLEIMAELPGFSTHILGSRNLDQALAADFDSDGRYELLLPDQTHTQLSLIERTREGVITRNSLPIGGAVSTNLAAVPFGDDQIVIGMGTTSGVLRLWLP